jgi:CheY-like chemotaxis protein
VLIAEGKGTARATLEPVLRGAGWNVLSVGSSIEVLRTLRDHDVNVLVIDPGLPGEGVSGVDVVRTLRSASRFRELPVFLLLDGDEPPPAGVVATGTLVLGRMSEERILAALLGALTPSGGRPGDNGTPVEAPAPTPPPPAPAPVTLPAGLDARIGAAVEAEARRLAADALDRHVAAIVRQATSQVVPEIAERLIRAAVATGIVEATVGRLVAEALERQVTAIVHEVARALVPEVAERLIRAEIARLRTAHGLDEPAR